MVGKDVTLKIEIRDDNVLLKSKIFTATDAFDNNAAGTSSSSSPMPVFSIASSSEVRIHQFSI